MSLLVSALRAEASEPTTNRVPAIYIVKYNRFVDNILERMNKILRRSYDPVSVKLQPIDASKNKNKKTKNKTKSSKRKSSNKKNAARADAEKIKNKLITKTDDEKPTDTPKDDEFVQQTQMEETQKPVAVEKVNEEAPVETPKETTRGKREVKTKEAQKSKSKDTAPKETNKLPTKTKTKKRKTNSKNKSKKNSVKKNEKSKPRAKGTLYGLSSLRRTGDVVVNIMSDHTTVKTNFKVGPMILKVEKEVGRGAKKELKSATATTAEMSGKLNLRIDSHGVATLHSIKVLQPKQMRVDSSDNHEQTREFVWEKSAKIAHVVSQKLMSASKPMFPSNRDE